MKVLRASLEVRDKLNAVLEGNSQILFLKTPIGYITSVNILNVPEFQKHSDYLALLEEVDYTPPDEATIEALKEADATKEIYTFDKLNTEKI